MPPPGFSEGALSASTVKVRADAESLHCWHTKHSIENMQLNSNSFSVAPYTDMKSFDILPGYSNKR